MTSAPADRAMSAAAAALLAFGVCLFMFLPPMVDTTTASIPLTVFLGLGMAAAMALHLVFIGIAAHRLQRRPWLWVLISLIGFPVSSIVGMVLLHWYEDDRAASPAPGTR